MEFQSLGKWLIAAGLALAVVGAIFTIFPKIPFLGRLPGDIVIKKEHFSFYFPLTTCLVISLLLNLLFRIFGKR